MEVIVRRSIDISCAHRLAFHLGKCHNEHGHNYRVEVFARSDTNRMSSKGMVKDFADIDLDLQEVVGKFDHSNLNPKRDDGTYMSILGVFEPMNPDSYWEETTCENLAQAWFYDMTQRDPEHYCGLRVWESERSYAQVGVCG